MGMRLRGLARLLAGVAALLVLIATLLYGRYVYTTLSDLDNLLICSIGLEKTVPKTLCLSYLFQRGLSRSEVVNIGADVGISWATGAVLPADRLKILRFLLDQGVDIDARNRRTGLTALHLAVLENDAPAVALLLQHGADASLPEPRYGRTALQLSQALQTASNDTDRHAVITLLEQHQPAR